MSLLTIKTIAEVLNAQLVNGEGAENVSIEGAAIDSRKIEKNFLFFAIKGEKSDGHDYIASVFKDGAACVVANRVPEGVTGPCVIVDDTVAALKKLASYYREQLKIKVVGVTGSIGKTTTKEFIATVLSQKYNVFRTDKNQNNLIGLPLSILNIKENNEVAVLEMGISEFGEMRELSSMAKPDICVITNISSCHLETLGSLDGVLKAKTEIFEFMNPDGEVCLFGDDEKLATVKEVNGKKPITYGLEESNDIHPVKILNRGLWGSEVTVENGEGMFNMSVPLAGKHMILSALAAVSVARVLELSAEQVSFGISVVKALQGRNNIMDKNGITIIDDCYNASPDSMKSALDLLTEAISPTVAILGDMFEQGENEVKVHEEIGEYAVEKEIGTLVCVGNLSKKMYDKAVLNHALKDKTECFYFATVDEAKEQLTSIIKKGDTVLLKASNGMKFNTLLNAITAEDVTFPERVQGDALDENTDTSFAKENASSFDTNTSFESKADSAPKTESSVVENVSEMKTVNVKKAKSADQKEKEDAFRQVLIIAGIAAAVILIGLGVFFGFKHKKYKEATRGEIVYSTAGTFYSKGWMDANKLNDASSDSLSRIEDENIPFAYDGKYFYYVSASDKSKLYYLKKSKIPVNEKANKEIEANIQKYSVIKKKEIIYLSNGNVYRFKPGKKETVLLCENVTDYKLNKKKDTLLYRNGAGEMFTMKINKPDTVEKLDDGVNEIKYADENFKYIIYYKNGNLYSMKSLNKNCKIADDAANLYIAENESGLKLYYTDSQSKLWYFAEKSLKAKEVSENGNRVFGKEFGYSSLMTQAADGSWKFVKDGKEYELKDFAAGAGLQVVGADKDNIYFLNRDSSTGINNLCSVSDSGLGNKKSVNVESTNVSSVEYIGDGNIFVCKEDGTGKHDLYSREELVARNVELGSVQKCKYGKEYVFAYQVSDSDGFYKIVMYDGSNIKEIGSSVSKDVCAISKKKVYMTVKGNSGFDIKVYNGKKARTYQENVDNFGYVQY